MIDIEKYDLKKIQKSIAREIDKKKNELNDSDLIVLERRANKIKLISKNEISNLVRESRRMESKHYRSIHACSCSSCSAYISCTCCGTKESKEINILPGVQNKFDIIKKGLTVGIEIECFLDLDTFKDMHFEHCDNYIMSIKDLLEKNKKQIWKNSIDFNKLKMVNNNFIFSKDGSVYGKRGIASEVKSKILYGDLTLSLIKDFYQIYSPKFNTTCGIHIHVGRIIDGQEIDLNSLAMFRPIIDYIIAPFFTSKDRYTRNNYCKPYLFTNNILDKNELIHASNNVRNMNTHYASTSISVRYPTIEFRHLAGTENVKKVIEFVSIVSNMMFLFNQTNRAYTSDIINKILTLDGTSEIKNINSLNIDEYKEKAFDITKKIIFNK